MTVIDGAVRMSPEVREAFDREWRVTCACPRLAIVERDGRTR